MNQRFEPRLIRARIFARKLQEYLNIPQGPNPAYDKISRELALKKLPYDKISASTWNAWWHGQRMPNASMKATLNELTNNLAGKWLEPSIATNRLSRHLCSFDLPFISKKQGSQAALAKAWRILNSVSESWRLNSRNEVEINGDRPITSNDLFSLRFPHSIKAGDSKPHLPAIGFGMGFQRTLFMIAPKDLKQQKDPLNPSSIIAFLVGFGIHAKDSEPGVNNCITLDLATAVICSLIILISNGHTRSTSGEAGELAYDLFELLESDDEWFPKRAVLLSIYLDDKFSTDCALDFLRDFRLTYLKVISQASGLTDQEVSALLLTTLRQYESNNL